MKDFNIVLDEIYEAEQALKNAVDELLRIGESGRMSNDIRTVLGQVEALRYNVERWQHDSEQANE